MCAQATNDPVIHQRPDHSLSRKKIQTDALKVLYRLHKSGFLGYLVGGGVRDHLLNRSPKDYDIATDARPQKIRKLFRNSRIIGRRFRLVHVYFHSGIVEVSTFRRDPEPQAQQAETGDLLITDDNAFGSPQEDAFRRDFTVNALFYNIADYSVIDYVGGMDDLRAGVIRVIGEPSVRFQEDPVRMLRACELAGRLRFTIDPATQSGIEQHAAEIERAAAPRLCEEISQLLRCGCSARAMQWIAELGLVDHVLPETRTMVAAENQGLGEFTRFFAFLDGEARKNRELPEIGVYSLLLLPAVLNSWERLEGGRRRPGYRQLREIAEEKAAPLFLRLGLSKHKVEHTAQTLLGYRKMVLGQWQTRQRVQLVNKPYFDDAFFLYRGAAALGVHNGEDLNRWERVRKQRPKKAVVSGKGRKRGRRRGRGKRAGSRAAARRTRG